MQIVSVEFAGAIASPSGRAPGDLPEIAFSGRSNVGKSSLINRLLGRTRRQIARVSATPGKTQEINFYRIAARLSRDGGTDFFLVDLPGYGYARAPASVRQRWRPLIEGYLSSSRELCGVVQLIDARHAPTSDDLRMVEYLAGRELPTLFVLTKFDKLSRSERSERVAQLVAGLSVDEDQVVPFSSKTGEGRELLLESLEELLVPGLEGR
jgi:GTP-binding protein